MKNTDVNPFTAMLGHPHSENDKSAKFELIQSFLLLGMSPWKDFCQNAQYC